MQFKISTNAPDIGKIPTKEDLFGASALIISASYRMMEFFRVGYYVYNNYIDEKLIENEPQQPIINEIYR